MEKIFRIFKTFIPLVFLLIVLSGCSFTGEEKTEGTEVLKESSDFDINELGTRDEEEIYLAGGCFWGVEEYFARLPGVLDTEVGYANGKTNETSYEDLSKTDHAESLYLKYDANKISLGEILDHFFRIIDPTSINKQGNDRGRQYRTGIYSDSQKVLNYAKDYIRNKQGDFNEKIVVEVLPLKNYLRAEDYHQDYLKKNPAGYCHVNLDLADKNLYGEYSKLSDEELKAKLNDTQYYVTQNAGTERAFTSEYDDFYEKGIYVDITSGEALFSSSDKYDSGSGWPSFTKAINSYALAYDLDDSYGMKRVEVRAKSSDAHLGHVFEDGPKDEGSLRYCINGASLEFIPYDEMDSKGYSELKKFVE